jgi:hypothetical protein
MISLRLKANPTFRAKVAIPVPGEKPVEVEFEFKHMKRGELEDWQKRNRKFAVDRLELFMLERECAQLEKDGADAALIAKKRSLADATNARLKDAPDDVATVMEIASNWFGIDGDFTEANLRELFDNYHAAPRAIGERYGEELTQARLGN